MLTIQNLHASVQDNPVLKGVSLTVKAGEVHAIMGPNGSGKSTLGKVLAGHPAYVVTQGDILFEGQPLADLSPDERARQGIFLGFQYPVEVPGVSNAQFLRMAHNKRAEITGAEELDPLEFDDYIKSKLSLIGMNASFLDRSVNEGFSGGEKKRNEILQMAVLDPTLAILDETDSGLDIDALRIVGDAITQLRKPTNATIVITHYQRLLDHVVPDVVHVLAGGRIIKSGGADLALRLEKDGYDWILSEDHSS